jgi:histidinol-phosphate aminotransferase
MATNKSAPGRVPPYIESLHAYVPGKPIQEVERELGLPAIKLASNENPYGPSPKALEAMKTCLPDSHRYPDAGGFYLRQKLAIRHQVEMNNIVLGCGSTELIQLACRVYCQQGGVGLTSEGTFIMFPLSVQAAGGEVVTVPLRKYTFDLDAVAAAVTERTRAVYFANPNNPTGTMFTAQEFDRCLARLPEDCLVILDEAYCDYVEDPGYTRSLDYVREGKYVLVLRTFSKIYGLAGVRIGYGLGHPEVIAALNKIRSPFNYSGLALAAAEAALDDTEHVRRSLEAAREGRDFLRKEFTSLGFTAAPSFTSFLYIETGHDPREAAEFLLQQGVIVRPLGFMGMPAGLRVTVGTPEENQKALDAFAVLKGSVPQHIGSK